MSVFQKGVNKVALWCFQNIALLVWVVQPAQHSNVGSANGVSLGRDSMSGRPVACKWNVREIGLKEMLYLRFGLVLQIAQKWTHFTFNILCVCVFIAAKYTQSFHHYEPWDCVCLCMVCETEMYCEKITWKTWWIRQFVGQSRCLCVYVCAHVRYGVRGLHAWYRRNKKHLHRRMDGGLRCFKRYAVWLLWRSNPATIHLIAFPLLSEQLSSHF